MAIYYRFQHERPKIGEKLHCFKTLEGLKKFARMMKVQDPEFHRVKFWEISGDFLKEDDGDAVVRVHSVKEIRL